MNRAEYVSRKVMDRYQDRLTIRLERMYTKIEQLSRRVDDLEAEAADHCHWQHTPVSSE